MQIETIFERDTLTVAVRGRIDAVGAPALQEALRADVRHLTLDFENVEYVSSSGLRALLAAQKKMTAAGGAFEVVNVSPEVYEVLDMTGFAEIMTVRRALRQVSVEGCPIIGRGSTGTVYRIDPETIVKVFNPQIRFSEIEREISYTKRAFVHGIPTEISYDIVRCGEQYGIVLELIDADTLSSTLRAAPETLEEYAEKYAKLLRLLHTTRMPKGELPDAKRIYLDKFKYLPQYLETAEIDALRELIESVPDRATILHGDAHPKNIMVQDGELVFIDMGECSLGHPVFDLADIYYSIVRYAIDAPERVLENIGMESELCRRTWDAMAARYFAGKTPGEIRKIEAQLDHFSMLRMASFIATFDMSKQKPEMAAAFCSKIQSAIRKDVLPYIDEMRSVFELMD